MDFSSMYSIHNCNLEMYAREMGKIINLRSRCLDGHFKNCKDMTLVMFNPSFNFICNFKTLNTCLLLGADTITLAWHCQYITACSQNQSILCIILWNKMACALIFTFATCISSKSLPLNRVIPLSILMLPKSVRNEKGVCKLPKSLS